MSEKNVPKVKVTEITVEAFVEQKIQKRQYEPTTYSATASVTYAVEEMSKEQSQRFISSEAKRLTGVLEGQVIDSIEGGAE